MYSNLEPPRRDDLIERYAYLVKRIAYHIIGRLPPSVAVDDLIQAGMIGLLDASGQYNPIQGASFETYASIRIRGAMLDELRRNDWAPKSLHRRTRDLTAAVQRIEGATGNAADDQTIADELGITLDEYFQLLQESSSNRMVSYEEMGELAGDRYQQADQEALPPEQLQQQEFRQQLAETIRELPERERVVLALYYEREINLREIGEVLNVSESRVSQILSKAHSMLRARLT